MELENIKLTAQEFQDIILANNNIEGIYGDGKCIATVP